MKTIRTLVVLAVAYYSTTGLCELIEKWREWRYERRVYRDFHSNFPGTSPHRNFSEIEELNRAVNEVHSLPEARPLKCFSGTAEEIENLPEATKAGTIHNSEF